MIRTAPIPGYVRVYTGARPPTPDSEPTGMLVYEIQLENTPEWREWLKKRRRTGTEGGF